jgi:hypothetical protein
MQHQMQNESINGLLLVLFKVLSLKNCGHPKSDGDKMACLRIEEESLEAFGKEFKKNILVL